MPLQIIRQDITKIKCDAIINPSNKYLYPGGSTDEAIHKAAGAKLLEACKKLGGCNVGEAKITPGFDLPCRYVIHTVGPVWIDGSSNESELLQNCYKSCLELARKKRCKSVAFPLISSGTYGYPKDKVLKVALDVIGDFLMENEMTVYIAVYDKKSYEISASLFADVKSFIDDNCVTDEPQTRHRQAFYGEFNATEADYDADGAIDEDDAIDARDFSVHPSAICGGALENSTLDSAPPSAGKSLSDMLKDMDKSFSEMLFYYIDLKGITDVQCYKKANVDKKTFSKIKCKKDYKPSKQTVLSFAIALELNLEETSRLLQTVGMALSNSSKFDVIVKYFIINGKYDIYEINETLFEFDQMLLGSV